MSLYPDPRFRLSAFIGVFTSFLMVFMLPNDLKYQPQEILKSAFFAVIGSGFLTRLVREIIVGMMGG